MISFQNLVSIFCIALYLISIIVFVVAFLINLVKELNQHHSIQRRSRQFPCGKCCYFTGEPLLKCAVHPVEALTNEAMNCQDFEIRMSHSSSYGR